MTLIEQVGEGWKVAIFDHDHLSESRDDVTVTAVGSDHLVLTSKIPWVSQGRSFSSTKFTWDGDKEVDGRRVRLYHTPRANTGKPRRLIQTLIFTPPAGWRPTTDEGGHVGDAGTGHGAYEYRSGH